MKKLNYDQKVIVYYAIIAALFILLSLISLIFSEWIISVGVGICSIIGLIITILLVKGKITGDADGSKIQFIVFTIVRYILMAVGLIAVAFLIKATMGENIDKHRYIYVAICAIPYFIPTIALMIVKYE